MVIAVWILSPRGSPTREKAALQWRELKRAPLYNMARENCAGLQAAVSLIIQNGHAGPLLSQLSPPLGGGFILIQISAGATGRSVCPIFCNIFMMHLNYSHTLSNAMHA